MTNTLYEAVGRHKQMIAVVLAAVAIASYMIPINSIAHASQSITQSNSISASNSGAYGTVSASGNSQSNTASNFADIHIRGHGHNYHGVGQSISQSNSITATNTGDFGTVTADNNIQSNTAHNSASVHVSGNSGHGHHYVGVNQHIDQSNSITASNSGTSGSVSTSGNTQTNDAHNSAHISISSHSHNNN